MAQTLETNRDWRAYWSTVDQRAQPGQLLAQVGRTVSGRPVSDVEVGLIAQAVLDGLRLNAGDSLLDLCCGNGLITEKLGVHCRTVVGVDYADYLIQVAQANTSAKNVLYRVGSADEIASLDLGASAPTALCINAGLQHFATATLERVLSGVREIGAPVQTMVFTDVPDADRIFTFYDTPERRQEFHRRRAERTEAIGTWWSREDLDAMLKAYGFDVEFRLPDPRRSTAHYRFDLLATRRGAAG